MERKEIIQTILLILVFIFIGVMVFMIVILMKNIDEIKSDPIIYGMSRNDIDTCICNFNNGRVVTYPSGEVIFNDPSWQNFIERVNES